MIQYLYLIILILYLTRHKHACVTCAIYFLLITKTIMLKFYLRRHFEFSVKHKIIKKCRDDQLESRNNAATINTSIDFMCRF